MLTPVFAAVLLIVFSLWWYINTRIPEKFPPGPTRYPILGSLRFILEISELVKNTTLIHGIFKNVEKYGKVFGFYVGSQPFVVIADYDTLKDVLKLDESTGRPDMTPINEFRPGHWTVGKENIGLQPGVAFSTGKYWREQRRFLLRNLRDFGYGKQGMEDTLLDEVEKLCTEYSKIEGKPLCLENTFNLSVINSLWAILTGEKLPLKDPKLLKIVSDFNDTLSKIKNRDNLMLPLSPRPLLRLTSVQKAAGLAPWKEALDNLTSIIEAQVVEHKSTIDPDSNRDMIDVFLNEIENTTDVDSSFYKDRGYHAMLNNFMDIFVAGMETTSSSLVWTFLYLLHHPDIKRKIHLELDQVSFYLPLLIYSPLLIKTL